VPLVNIILLENECIDQDLTVVFCGVKTVSVVSCPLVMLR